MLKALSSFLQQLAGLHIAFFDKYHTFRDTFIIAVINGAAY